MSEAIEVVRPVWKPFIGVIYGFRLMGSAEFRYVGLTTTSMRRRTQQHFKKAAADVKNPFYDWLRKHDESEIFVQSLEVVTSYPADLGVAEKRWIELFHAEGHRLLNLTEGGLGPTGYVWTDEQRKAAGDRARGRPTGISRKGPDSPAWGLRHTDEQRLVGQRCARARTQALPIRTLVSSEPSIPASVISFRMRPRLGCRNRSSESSIRISAKSPARKRARRCLWCERGARCLQAPGTPILGITPIRASRKPAVSTATKALRRISTNHRQE